ncbi:ricin-type beta-trefoil lectin domain protein [Dactylosporangium aurantiacum]|uniref:Ricin-type beta-trefoil lectin domain protein n=2 Tax=Dactylosporangium aurantiacum TaxID=35754 RepID=A0A9Q9MHT6_9ACTN|nr:ricin-type beta-trefoil lectin domain protein [Dactylosporangium aurantiacum]MDG6107328.1 ricin-type beta-trefoil lectin domain protein [Dactylosporangium aurantiacum]UWZ59843.1 ricin-type beta-trefoil lectin domain protein [Dactylosporangium aurantiacum]
MVAVLAGAVAALAAIPAVLIANAPPASAATGQFQGLNWARPGDNYTGSPLVLAGLSGTDSYSTVRAKADAIYAGFQGNLGANTVRLPINTYTVGTAWWDSYTGAIDAATARNMKVILSYWDDGRASSGGRLTDTGAFNTMWNTVVAKYAANPLVHFEPMNEPHGYSAADWKNVAAAWMSARPSVPRNRIFISGSGLNQDIKTMCADSRFDGTYLSLHHYTFFSGAKTYDGWVSFLRDAIGTCASRTVIDEFGAPMDTGLNYNDANSTDNFVRYFRATTQVLRELQVGSVYWPGLGGKITAGQSDDWYAMQKLHGTGTSLTLSTPNASGAERLRYAWGLVGTTPTDGGSSSPATGNRLRNTGSGRCLDVPGGRTTNGTQVTIYDCNNGTNQQWVGTAARELRVYGNKCLDATGRGTANGTAVVIYDCNGGTNQQWTLNSNGTITGVASGRCLDVAQNGTANGSRIQLWDCTGGANQAWVRA